MSEQQPEPIDESVRIVASLNPADTRLVVGGVDLSVITLSAVLRLAVDDFPRLTLELEPGAIEALLTGADIHVQAFDAPVRAALTAAGWTPPEVAR